MQRVSRDTGAWAQKNPNHVLVNAYSPGVGIQVRSTILDCFLNTRHDRFLSTYPREGHIWLKNKEYEPHVDKT